MYRKSEKFADKAAQAWPILRYNASLKQTMTYQELARRLYGTDARRVMGAILGHIARYCTANGLPQLNVIVVNKQTRRPGYSIPLASKDFDEMTERVFAFDWNTISAPTAAMLA